MATTTPNMNRKQVRIEPHAAVEAGMAHARRKVREWEEGLARTDPHRPVMLYRNAANRLDWCPAVHWRESEAQFHGRDLVIETTLAKAVYFKWLSME